MEKKPLVISDGEVEQLQSNDELAVEKEVDKNTLLIAKLVKFLVLNDFEIEDEQLLDLLQYVN